jgi:ribosome maturation factor RimP
LSGVEPDLEVLLVEQAGYGRLRLFNEHTKGVDLALCERVTRQLSELLEEYSLEVSSPGPARPLVKPDHFRRFVGRRVKVRTRSEHEGRRSFTGELVGATDDQVTVAADDGVVSIPYTDINRSNLVEE